MGKVQSVFPNGVGAASAGTPSRSIDEIIISKKNAAPAVIPFGVPVFMKSDGSGVILFASGTTTQEQFVGITVRIPDKTPTTFGSNIGNYGEADMVDILVRGAIIMEIATSSAKAGDKVYIRIADGKYVTSPGAEGSTMQIPGAVVNTLRDDNGCCEVILRARNLM